MSSKDVGTSSKKCRKRVDGFEEWGGYMDAKKMKLEAQFQACKPIELKNEQKSEIFKGVSIFVNGYTNPSAEELKRLMLLHGGTYHFYYSHSKTTHIVASNLPNSKIKNLKKEIVVKAQWITDSIKAGKLASTQDYLLYSPETKDKQQRLHFEVASELKTEHCLITTDPTTSLVSDCELESHNLIKSKLCEINTFTSEPSPPCLESLDSDKDESEKEIDFQLPTLNGNLFTKTSHLEITSDASLSLHKYEPVVKAGHPEFLSEFYSHSRLHHISTAGQDLKLYVQQLVENNSGFPGRDKLKNLSLTHNLLPNARLMSQEFTQDSCKLQAVIMHLDMDCFFVSVGLRKHPELIGYPVAVTHSKGNKSGPQRGSDIHYEVSHYENKSEKKIKGLTTIPEDGDFVDTNTKPKLSMYSKEYGSLSEIASCSYEARKAGVQNGMFVGEALRRCPNLKMISYDFDGYSEVSKQLYDIVSSYTLKIEAISCDELYVDCTELLQDTNVSPYQFAETLRADIAEKTNCTASAGLGPNMLLARLANKAAKPNGQYYVIESEIEEFMKKQKVDDLPGVGYRTSKRLQELNIVTCSDLQNLTLLRLQQEFGPKSGEALYKKCRGKDSRTVQLQKTRKSVSAEINYGIRFETTEDVNNFINEMAIEVQNRLQKINCKGKTITLKLMVRKADAPIETAKFMGHGVCDNFSKSVILKSATNSSKLIANECCTLARAMKIDPQDFRGVGIQVSKLESAQNEKIACKILTNFFNQTSDNISKVKDSASNGTISPKKAKAIEKPLLEKSTIKQFLSKPQNKLSYNLTDYVPEQLDQSVLKALPEDIRKEILLNCGKPTSFNHITSPPRKSLSSNSSTNTPVSRVKFKQKKNLNKCFNTKLFNSVSLNSCTIPVTSTTTSSSKYVTDSQSNSKSPLTMANGSMNSESQKKRVIDFFVTWKGKESKPRSNSVKKASLGGAIEVNEVRQLLREWIVSTQAPIEEDIEELKQFLLDSIDEDLDKVTLLLKYFYRLASSHGPLWKEAYLSTLSNVQQKMLQNFGAMLTASSDFPA